MVKQVVVRLIEEWKDKLAIQRLCKILNISRATYYRWKKEANDDQGSDQTEAAIRELCVKHKFRYGYRKITEILRQEQLINHKAVQRIMQKYGWQCRMKVKKRKQTGQPYMIAQNLLNRKFIAEKPLEKLVTDITYLLFGGKSLYLSSILDVYNSEIIVYTIGEKQDISFVLDTLHQLPKLPEVDLLHSGSRFCVYISCLSASSQSKRHYHEHVPQRNAR